MFCPLILFHIHKWVMGLKAVRLKDNSTAFKTCIMQMADLKLNVFVVFEFVQSQW